MSFLSTRQTFPLVTIAIAVQITSDVSLHLPDPALETWDLDTRDAVLKQSETRRHVQLPWYPCPSDVLIQNGRSHQRLLY